MEKRDLKADLELCNKATPGPWKVSTSGNVYPVDGDYKFAICCGTELVDAKFIAQAREGWPYAIRRALEAEIALVALQMAFTDAKALNREMLKVLERMAYLSEEGFMIDEADDALLDQVITKAREVLGDA